MTAICDACGSGPCLCDSDEPLAFDADEWPDDDDELWCQACGGDCLSCICGDYDEDEGPGLGGDLDDGEFCETFGRTLQ